MVMDYARIKEVVQPLVDQYLDHWHLNDSLGMENPTSENVAKWVYEQVKPKLASLDSVIIQETCTSKCTYRLAVV